MVDLAILDWFVLECLPLGLEISVFEVDLGGTNQVIAEEIIIVHDINLERWATWEG